MTGEWIAAWEKRLPDTTLCSRGIWSSGSDA